MAVLLQPANALWRELEAELPSQVPGPDLLGYDANILIRLGLEDTQRVVQRALVAADDDEDIVGGKLIMLGEGFQDVRLPVNQQRGYTPAPTRQSRSW